MNIITTVNINIITEVVSSLVEPTLSFRVEPVEGGYFIGFGLEGTDDAPIGLTDSSIISKAALLQADYDAQAYSRARTYPPIGEQLDQLFWDKKNGTTTWQDAIQAVKDAHPKS